MIAVNPAALGVPSESGRRLVGPAALVSPMALLRAQVGSRATARGPDGSWAEFLADTARFQGAPGRLLIEGQRTNTIRNPRGEGVVLGAAALGASTIATNWGIRTGAGYTLDVLGSGVEGGLPYIDMRYVGTGTHSIEIGFESLNGITFTPSATYAVGLFARVVAGGWTNISNANLRLRVDSPSSVSLLAGSILAATGAALADQRFTGVATVSAVADRGRMQLSLNGVGAADITLRLAVPTCELGGFASSPVLPAIGAPAACTRGVDLAGIPLSALGTAGPCTVLWRGVLPQAAPAGVAQSVFQLDDGSDANRYLVFNEAGGGTLVLQRRIAGIADATAGAATVPGTPFRLGVTINGAGRAAMSVDGGPVQAVTGGPVSGLTTLRLGATAAGGDALFGEVGALVVRPFALPDAALPAAVAAMPG